MVNNPEQFVEMNKAALETFQAVFLKSVEGFEKLAELNIQAVKTSLAESSEHMKAAMNLKDAKSLGDLTNAGLQPAVDKFGAYARHVYEIGSETSAEIAKLLEKQFADGNKQFSAAMEEMTKNAPAGSEGVVTLVKTAMNAANNAFDQVNKATKQAVEMAEQNMAAATKTAARPAAAKKAA
ncbi:MAG TPA: phasin family protein [Quisquiliibacterium sp.]|nr:phasin family protein [Quisquiliibacterium sp.]